MPEPKLTLSADAPPNGDLALACKSLFHLFPRWDFRVHDEIDSTNSEARRIAREMGGDAWPRVVLADYQTKGRGRQGRTWESPRAMSLLATVMAPRASFPVPPSLLPICMAVWANEGLSRTGIERAEYKWPNDLLSAGRKIAGILCETSDEAVLLGIGVNIDQQREDLPERSPREPQPTSIRLELENQHPGRLACVLAIVGAILESIENPGQVDAILEEYRSRCITFGTTVAFRDATLGQIAGEAETIDGSGALVVNVQGHGQRLATAIEDADD